MGLKTLTALAILAVLSGMATAARAEVVPCPPAIRAAPAVATMGPYLATGFKTAEASTIGLPNCEAARNALGHLTEAAPPGIPLVLSIMGEDDGTYRAVIEKM